MEYDTFSYASIQTVYSSTDHLMSEMINPDLKYSSLSTLEPAQWYPHSFQRVPMPPNGTQYFMNSAFGSRQPDGVASPIPSQPPPMLARQGTPSKHPSSASSRALNSGGSDHTPSTPPDEATYSFHNQCDPWSSQTPSQMVQMTGMSDGVKLGDVNSLDDEVFQEFHEEKTTELPSGATLCQAWEVASRWIRWAKQNPSI
ncbi:hypothetical protein PG994_010260 [Apiospora phragmitis]|uniref:Uncharacterized protein n=1 Tax=Apiospora phragmitis TaxID=2905665 RepID=A0ABR1TRP2_9PEZI